MRIIAAFFFFVVPLFSATYQVTQAGAGSGSGSSLANAMSVASQNSGTFSGDDIIILNGTITSQVVVNSSGTSGHPITYLFATGAKISASVWTTSGGFYLANKSYIVIDGGGSIGMANRLGGNPALANGVVENTANGTGLANSQESCGLFLQEAKSVTVKNLLVRNIYVRTGTTDTVDGGRCIRFADTNGNGMNDITVTNCILHDAMGGIGADYGVGDSDYNFYSNVIYNTNHSISAGGRGGSSTLTNFNVYDNKIYDWSNWDETVTNAFHHNGVFAFADGSSERITNINVYNNVFGPGWGGAYQTSGIYLNAYIQTLRAYNNLFINDPGEYASNGMIALSSLLPTTFVIANNTHIGGGEGEFIHLSGSTNGSAQTMTLENNLGSGGGDGTFIALYSNADVTLVSNYNLSYSYNAALQYVYSSSGSGVFKTFAEWQALGFDAQGINGEDPLLTASYYLGTGSPAIGTATDLSAYFTTDADGLTRTIPWDIGAYKYVPPASSLSGNLRLSGTASIK